VFKLLCGIRLYYFFGILGGVLDMSVRVTLSVLWDKGLVGCVQYGNTVDFLVYG
jgi:hypothetical protein